MDKHPPRTGLFATAVVILIVLSIVSGGRTRSDGPLQNLTSNGQSQFTIAWAAYTPGQTADFAAYVVNNGPGRVRLLSAALIPVPGHPAGKLTHLAVTTNHDSVGAQRGWPPGIPIVAFSGAYLPTGQSNIIFGFKVRHAGRVYQVAGIKITYSYASQTYTTEAWSAATACVVHRFSGAADARCSRQSTATENVTQELAR
jgi:hypothetical protein